MDDTWRQVSSKAGADMTLAIGWPDTDPITTYSLFAVAYNPSTLAVGKIQNISVYDGTTSETLDYIDPIEFTEEYLASFDRGTPEKYTILKYSQTGFPILAFGPIPDTSMPISMRYYRRPQLLSLDTDTPMLPPHWQHVVEEGALADLYGSFLLDQYQANRHEHQFDRLLRTMMAESQGSTRQVSYMGGPKRRADYDKVDPYHG
jgi:hypothetical protein